MRNTMIHVVAFLAPSFWMNLPSRIIHQLKEFRVNITIKQDGLCDHLKRKKFLTLTSYHFCISTPILKLEMTTFVVFTQLLTGRENSLIQCNGQNCLWSLGNYPKLQQARKKDDPLPKPKSSDVSAAVT